MTLRFRNCEFVKTAAGAEGFISDGRPQAVFSGRSNVGKSSVINALAGRRGLARISSSPGKTANVNYFLVDGKAYLVDLPGYGYARVSDSERRRWGSLMESFFASPGAVSLGVMIVDMRHRPTADDVTMARWFMRTGKPVIVVANKADKVKRSEAEACVAAIRETLPFGENVGVLPFSAEKGTNRDKLIAVIGEYFC
ncbi:MAG: ribosome biogenesis GTP-binding protein YihA/YsxC [Oscillospiraceae bacterium]|jgi:GTP-binding protein|nr:ribosome biogenesis GTP-binding protein YihA/YsxC [Oscillospiraceae bacterium]